MSASAILHNSPITRISEKGEAVSFVIKNMPDKLAVVPVYPTDIYQTVKQALAVMSKLAEENGFTKVKIADETPNDCDDFRVTATTPGGRAGRNIGYIEPYYGEEEW